MNQKKSSRIPIVSLAKLKGKPSALSVPSIRFNPGEDDLEEIEENFNDDSSVLKPVVEFGISDNDNLRDRRLTLTSSTSADATKELSPVKDVLQKFNKRSSSLDSGSYTESSSNDAWSLFHDLKGKITKTVEETLHIDLRSNGNTIIEKPLSQYEKDIKTETDDISDLEKYDFELELGKDAVKSITNEIDEPNIISSKKQTANITNMSTSGSFHQSPTEKLQAFSADICQRRAKFMSKSDEPSMTMSFLATKSVDDDYFEEELHDEYVREIQHEQSVKTVEDEKLMETILPEIKNANLTNASPLHVAKTPKTKSFYVEQKYFIYVLLTITYVLLPIPSYLSGFILGVVVSFVILMLWYQLTKPVLSKQPHVYSGHTSSLPRKPSVISNKSPIVFKGWMNQLRQPYNPMDYHVAQTFSVFIRLEGKMLRISVPKTKIPKHATFNEPKHDVSFCKQRYYNLSGCSIILAPEGLTSKRLWSRKYPLCIMLNDTACSANQMSYSNPVGANGDNEIDASSIQEWSSSSFQEDRLYLFTRTNRDKEEWYWRFKYATQLKDEKIMETRSAPSSPKHSPENQNDYIRNIVSQVSLDGKGNLQTSSVNSGSVPDVSQLIQDSINNKSTMPIEIHEFPMSFDDYMKLLLPENNSSIDNFNLSEASSKEVSDVSDKKDNMDSEVSWLNVFVGRCFWDFLREKYWTNLVQMKIQKKLSKIKVPYFMEELIISNLEFGFQLPVIKRVSSPKVDDRGLWIDLDVTYNGVFKMTLETKLNLLKKDTEMKELKVFTEDQHSRPAIFDSDEEDSAESSSEDEGSSELPEYQSDESSGSLPSNPGGSGTSKKLLRIVDKITQSRYFQHATEYKYVRRAVQEVSNTRLILAIEVHKVQGTVALNIPPPPSDRLWYGFRTSPLVTLVAKPRLGEREVTVSSVTEWIEKKLIQEFQKVFVIPNMDDIVIPFMSSGMHPTATPAAASAQASPNHVL